MQRRCLEDILISKGLWTRKETTGNLQESSQSQRCTSQVLVFSWGLLVYTAMCSGSGQPNEVSSSGYGQYYGLDCVPAKIRTSWSPNSQYLQVQPCLQTLQVNQNEHSSVITDSGGDRGPGRHKAHTQDTLLLSKLQPNNTKICDCTMWAALLRMSQSSSRINSYYSCCLWDPYASVNCLNKAP